MKKILILFTITALTLTVFTSCGAFGFFGDLFGSGDKDGEDTDELVQTEATEEIIPEPYPVIIDGVQIEKSPKKIISLSPVLTEILFEFKEENRLTAHSKYCDYPRDLLTSEQYLVIDYNADEIIKYAPDVLFLSAPIPEKDRVEFERANIAAIVITAPKNTNEFKNIYRIMGIILYGGFIGAENGEEIFAPIEKAYENGGNSKKLDLNSFVYITENMAIATGDTLEHSILSQFGDNLAEKGKDYVFDVIKILQEEKQPRFVLLNDVYTIEDLQNHEVFSKFSAVKEGRVIPLNNLYFEKPTSRVITLLTEMQSKYKDMNF